MLVVTCNPDFYGKAARGQQPTRVRIATVGGQGGEVTVYLRSREEMRRLFRDAGLRIVDEASPSLPSQFATLRTFDPTDFNLALPPLHFWLLEMHSTQRHPVAVEELREWLKVLKSNPEQLEATQVLLEALVQHVPDLAWRNLPKGAAVLGSHNVGGRIFVVKEGAFDLKSRRISNPKGSGEEAVSRWLFNPGEIFGELELFQEGKERERLYVAHVVAKVEGSSGHARVLEVPYKVTQQLMSAEGPLGSPFLTLLRGKVLEALLRFDERLLDDQITQKKYIERLIGNHGAGPDMKNLEGRIVVIVASLIAQGLEAEREQRTFGLAKQRMILISAIRDVVDNFIGKTDTRTESNRVNLAIRFLAGSGVIRRARSVVSEKPVGEERVDIERRREASQRLKKRLLGADWVPNLANEQKEVLRGLMRVQADCFFIVDDEIALRRCVLEPSYSLFEDLASRRQVFLQQPQDVERAKDDYLEEVIANSLKMRFESGLWQYDSLGWPIIKQN